MQSTVTEYSISRLLLFSFLATILVGSLLLMLPMSWGSTAQPVFWVDALFTATSAVCVTGLTVLDTGTTFSGPGQLIILVLIQVGGLGILTFSTFFITRMRPRRFGVDLSQRMLLETSHGAMSRVTPKGLLVIIFVFTFAVELMGASLLFWRFSADYPLLQAGWMAMFHAISAFCNAGFGLLTDNLMRYRGDVTVNWVIMGLIILGGLGFVVVADLLSWGRGGLAGKEPKLSLHSLLVLRTTLFLILFGGFAIAITEWGGVAMGNTPGSLFLESFFLSVTSRTAGFNTVAMEQLTNSTLYLVILLMIIGGSPGSTAGGIKTTTMAVCYALLSSRARNRPKVECLGHSLPEETVTRSLLIVAGYILVTVVGTFLLHITEGGGVPFNATQGNTFLAYLFETVSALGTVGLTTGLTPNLTVAGKLVIITLMFVGRVGPLLLATVLLGGVHRVQYSYPEENVNIG
ncbi:MAG: hypothetical protein HQL94_11030 [Magnetococcales bacterium]|nr:hypothetical protein [Magnetococcales bacterium]MBF0439196.1 hypothetical protein [Magnetococcales bacterium]